MATAQVDAALDLVKRLPPENVVNTLSSLVELAPSLTEELLSRIDQPLQARPLWANRTTKVVSVPC